MRRWWWALMMGGVVAAGLWGLDRAFPPPLERVWETARVVTAADGSVLRVQATADGLIRLPATVDDVAPRYRAFLLAYEDRRFPWHPGVDPLALGRAVAQGLWRGEVVSGASTLTMQVARLLDPGPRTVPRKLREMARALQLEVRYSKDEILGLYLTLAPFGGALEGVRAGSHAWFGKPPARLTAAEAALLVVLPQAPNRLRPDRHPVAARAARDKVLRRVLAHDPAALAAALRDPVPTRRRPLPLWAPHLADRIPGTATLVHAPLQRAVQAAVRRHARREGPATSAAALVVSLPGREVRAMVGAADYLDRARGGGNDMSAAVRSPGSALKPFLYGAALAESLIHPATRIADRPRGFAGYRPGNFDGRYHGTVTVTEALQTSLNIPAVAVAEALGPAAFMARLRQAGVPLRLPPHARPTAAVALGGVGMTLAEGVTLYAALGDAGGVRPLRWQADSPTAPARRLLPPAATAAVVAMLRGTPPPTALAARRARAEAAAPVATKTGTSYGFRDAWAFGVTPSHAVGVWVGRPDGTPRPGRSGRAAALPLLYAVLDAVAERDPHWHPWQGVPALPGVPPPALARLRAPVRETPPPRISFPPADATLAVLGGGQAVPLEADGGRPPLRWVVNGRPLAPEQRLWRPGGAGAARLGVVDADGRQDHVQVWVTP